MSPTPVSTADLPRTDATCRADELARARPALDRYVRALVAPDVHRADDIVQETLLRAWQHRDRLDWCVEPIRPWLFRTARNLVIDAWRRDRTTPVGDPSVLGERVDMVNLAERVSDRRALVDGLRRLPPDHAEVLVHVYVFGHGTDDVARALGIPPGTVKSRTHYAVRALRQALGDVREPVTAIGRRSPNTSRRREGAIPP